MDTTTGWGRRIRSRFMRRLSIGIALAGVAAAGACREGSIGPSPYTGTTYGPAVALGSGSARVYLQLTEGTPVELGIALSEDALSELPGHDTPGGVHLPDGHHMFEYVLAMPENNPTPFRHVLIDWNPGGHEPPGIYDLPHFDFHFYTISEAGRRAIDPANPQFAAQAERFPDAAYTPVGYTAIPGAIPFMGKHWVEPTSPELNGETFTQTFIYGSWDGRLIFAEPMITKAFLESKPDFTRTLPVPDQYAEPGFYPASYSIRWDAESGEYQIALGSFALH